MSRSTYKLPYSLQLEILKRIIVEHVFMKPPHLEQPINECATQSEDKRGTWGLLKMLFFFNMFRSAAKL